MCFSILVQTHIFYTDLNDEFIHIRQSIATTTTTTVSGKRITIRSIMHVPTQSICSDLFGFFDKTTVPALKEK